MKRNLVPVAVITTISVAVVLVAFLLIQISGLKTEIDEKEAELSLYKRTFDGLILFEDGSWMFEEGEYYEFWNWKENLASER